MGFNNTLENIIQKNTSLLCIGLDTDLNKIPDHLKSTDSPIFSFNKSIIDSTHHLVCAYKPNLAYYEAYGIAGMTALKMTVDYLKQQHPEIPVIADAKRGDIGSTSEKYAESIFDYFGFDAITVNPYMGMDSIEPFFRHHDKGIIVLCRTSNPGASDFQDLIMYSSNEVRSSRSTRTIKPLYLKIAEQAVNWQEKYANCLLVVGATWPEQMEKIRKAAPNLLFLVPGVGTQGGELEQTLNAGLRQDGSGLIMTASRSIIYAGSGKDFADKARIEAEKLRDTINRYR